MVTVEASDPGQLDAALEAIPNQPGVFLLWPREGQPYLSKTAMLRRRLLRLLREREKPSRLLNLRHTAARVEYALTASALESSVVHYELARRHFPETYLELLKLRLPPYVKLLLNNEYPRTTISNHLARTASLYFGPFRSRASAERFEGQFLDLFQVRRCQEDLAPSPEHPGCIYGEMGMCLRPCQTVVGSSEYAQEVARVVEFLRTDGRSLSESIERSRDRLSEEMQFEEAARQHKRLEKVREALALRDELARDVDHLNGVAVTASIEPESVALWPVCAGHLQGPIAFSYEVQEGKTVSLDRKLREVFAGLAPVKRSAREREERLAILSRWFYSSWRDGEFLSFDSFEDAPFRKLVNAVSRVARPQRGLFET
jgi:excinuclease UvrABC nuclease subunit